MAVIREYDISTVDKVKSISLETRKLQQDRKYDEYTPEHIMLVRTTDVFPHGRKMSPVSHSNNVIMSDSNFICQGLRYVDEDERSQFETYNPIYRSTLRFTENGLVSSHMYGNFENRPFIILEPISSQLDKADFRNFAGHDTFIKGEIELSNKAIIIIRKDKYEEIKNTYPEIESFNVILYNGIPEKDKEDYINNSGEYFAELDVLDDRAIVERVLIDLGYTPEIVADNHLIDSPTSEKVGVVNDSLAAKYGVTSGGKHWYSEERQNDFDTLDKVTSIYDEELFNFIISINNIDIKEIPKNENTGQIYMNDAAEYFYFVLGKEPLLNSVNMFNKTIEIMKYNNDLPITESLLNGNKLNVYDYYINLNLGDNFGGPKV